MQSTQQEPTPAQILKNQVILQERIGVLEEQVVELLKQNRALLERFQELAEIVAEHVTNPEEE